jgi:DNA-binding PadR family transcriptional regulator
MKPERDQLLLGEWACLGILYAAPTHGFAVSARLKPDGDIGRVWSMSRALTYRALDQLTARGLVQAVGQEPGVAGGNRTVQAATRVGRAAFRRWVTSPVLHLRDLRTELLLKFVLADECSIDLGPMLTEQRRLVAELSSALHTDTTTDVVAIWRSESSQTALRVLDRLSRN